MSKAKSGWRRDGKGGSVPRQWPKQSRNYALCDKCADRKGHFARCLRCALIEEGATISRMCYALEGYNEFGVSEYDVFPSEEMVLAKLQAELATLRFTVWKQRREILQKQREINKLEHQMSRMVPDMRDFGWG